MRRVTRPFSALIAAQAAHSVEEYAGRLWESFPPAAFVTSLLPPDPGRAFLAINTAIVAFGLWCVRWPVRRRWPSATAIAWGWVAVETINGAVHTAWSVHQGGYTPGLLTAPMLLAAAACLAFRLSRTA